MSNNSASDSSMEEIYRKSLSLSIEQIRELLQDDYSVLARIFGIELGSGKNAFEVSQIWKRWLPLIRDEKFVQTLEQVTSQIETEVPYEMGRRILQQIRNQARSFNRMTEEEVEHFFESRSDSQKLDTAITEGQAYVEYQMAMEAATRGDLVGARIHYERAIDAFAGTKNAQMRAQAMLNLANVLARAGQLSQAVKLYEQVARAFELLDDTTNVGLAFHNLGRAMLSQHQLEQALQFAERGLRALIPSKPDADRVAEMCANLMLQVIENLPLSERINRYRQVARVLEESKLKRELARTYLLMASALAQMNRFDEGSEAATRGLKSMMASNASVQEKQWALQMHGSIWRVIGRSEDEWLTAVNKLLATPSELTRLGDMCLALTKNIISGKLGLDDARGRLRKEHNRESFTSQAVAILADDMQNTLWRIEMVPAESLKTFEVNLSLLLLAAELTGSHEAGSVLQLSLGRLYDRMGRYMEAVQAFERGAELAKLSGNTEFRITMWLNSVNALHRAGESSAAIDRLESLLTELQAVNAQVRQPEIYLRLADLYEEQRNLHEAEGAALNGQQIITSLHGLAPETMVHLQATEAALNSTLGLMHKYTDRYARAEKYLQRSLDLYHKLEDQKNERQTLGNLAGVRLDVGDIDGALELYNLCYQMIERLPPSPSYSFIYTGRAIVLSLVGQIAEARRMALLALQMNPSVKGAAQCVSVLMDTASNNAELLDAQQRAEQLLLANPSPMAQLPILSRLSQHAGALPEQKREWQGQLHQVADTLHGLQGAYAHLSIANQHDETEEGNQVAIEHLERCIALVDEVAAGNPDRAIQREIFTTGSRATELLLQLKPEDDHTNLEILLRTKARATLHQRFMVPRTLSELREQLSQQSQPVLLVEMYVLPTQSLLYFVTAEGLQGVEHLPITTEVLMAENGIITELGNIQRYKAAWQSETWSYVSEQFAGALAHYLHSEQLVCLIPAGFWHFLPLHACLLNGRPLIEGHPIYYGPSSSILSYPGDARRLLQRCLAVGVEFEREAEWVANWFGSRAVLGSLADPGVIAMSMIDEDVVHFSCHGAYNPLRGSESGLVMAHHSWLTPALLERWTTDADLVTLSACETAFNFVTAGNDVVGLDQTLLNMGAVSVLGTLWKVEARSSEYFVKAFYEHLTGVPRVGMKQMSKAHALQKAVAQVRTNNQFDHPFYWAPFKLTGGWL